MRWNCRFVIVRKIAASVSSALGRVGEKLAAICVIVLLMSCLFLQVAVYNHFMETGT